MSDGEQIGVIEGPAGRFYGDVVGGAGWIDSAGHAKFAQASVCVSGPDSHYSIRTLIRM